MNMCMYKLKMICFFPLLLSIASCANSAFIKNYYEKKKIHTNALENIQTQKRREMYIHVEPGYVPKNAIIIEEQKNLKNYRKRVKNPNIENKFPDINSSFPFEKKAPKNTSISVGF